MENERRIVLSKAAETTHQNSVCTSIKLQHIGNITLLKNQITFCGNIIVIRERVIHFKNLTTGHFMSWIQKKKRYTMGR